MCSTDLMTKTYRSKIHNWPPVQLRVEVSTKNPKRCRENKIITYKYNSHLRKPKQTTAFNTGFRTRVHPGVGVGVHFPLDSKTSEKQRTDSQDLKQV